jgi:antitoxin PrlF
MNFTSTVTTKGQTTVPKEVRKLLGLGPRQKILYKIDESGVRIEAAGKSLMRMAGVLAGDEPMLSRKEEKRIAQQAFTKRHEKADN